MNFDQYQLNFNLAQRFAAGRGGARIVEGPLGVGLTYDQAVIHNAEDPWGEARDLVERAPRDRTDRTPGLALVFGLGLGYHLRVLRENHPDIRLVVFEPVPEMKNIHDRHTVFDPGAGEAPIVVTEWRRYEETVSRELVYGRRQGVVVVAPEGYQRLRPEAYGAFHQYTRKQILRRAVIDRTRDNTDSLFLSHLAANAGRFPDLPDLLVLKGRLPSRPAFLVGSGPSLDQSFGPLSRVGDRGLILASSSALKPLLRNGVRPDVVLVLESEDTSDYLRLTPEEMEILGSKTVLALASSCHPAHFQAPGFHQALFHLTAGEAQTFGSGAHLPQGGNSGTALFALAFIWGLGPLVLVGQDQAYGQGKLHAEGTPGEVDESGRETLTVRGVGETVVETNSGLLASASWYEEAAKTIAAQSSPPALYNSSASGARLAGFTEMPLDAVAASLAPAGAPLDLAGVLPRLPRPSPAELLADVTQLAGVVNALRRLAVRDHQTAYREIKNVGQVSKFLEQILAEALGAAGQAELIKSLDEVDGLLTVMMSSLTAH